MSRGLDGSDKNILTKLDFQSILESDGDITKSRIQKLTDQRIRMTGIMQPNFCFIPQRMNVLHF